MHWDYMFDSVIQRRNGQGPLYMRQVGSIHGLMQAQHLGKQASLATPKAPPTPPSFELPALLHAKSLGLRGFVSGDPDRTAMTGLYLLHGASSVLFAIPHAR